MKFQYEQQCNAYALKQLGIPVIWASTKNWLAIIHQFINRPQTHQFNFPDQTASIVAKVVKDFAR